MSFNKLQESHLAFRDLVGERTSPIIAWVGAGLSVAAGLPTWSNLKNTLIKSLRNKADDLVDQDKIKLLSLANNVEKEDNNWLAFQILRQNLGPTTYREVIKEEFLNAPMVKVPESYCNLWKLKIHGLLNLNIDRLATRSFSEINPITSLVEFDGFRSGKSIHVLNTSRRFVANLHGKVDDTSSWVFTKGELSSLIADGGYQTLIRTCLASCTILFIGITADDFAVGGHLEALTSMGVETRPHYWLTDRRDLATDKWAEGIGIRIIRYDAPAGDHSAVREFFEDLLSYIPQESTIPPPPVALCTKEATTELLTAEELAHFEAEDLRVYLNKYATGILGKGDEEDYRRYQDFYEKYDEPIYRAWYTSTDPEKNLLLGYRLENEVAQGAFGRVFKAINNEGKYVAIKLLREDIRRKPDLLRCFRRGVRSMRILQKHGVKGMVSYNDASEIPALVSMEWVEGPNLNDAVKSRQIENWETIIRISRDMAEILNHAHSLPERVLHRDLRPSNVMLEGFYTSPNDWEVKVLDFDLSWHKGAAEESVIHSAVYGYLAPEQIEASPVASTRHSAVDSFGLGMTLYYIISRKDPLPNQHLHKDWEKYVEETAKNKISPAWRSLPFRFSRLIIAATRHKQAERWDLGEIKGELNRLYDAMAYPMNVKSAELISEELAARTDIFSKYRWDFNKASARKELPTGMNLELASYEQNDEIILSIEWTSTGTEDRRQVGKWIRPATEKTIQALSSSGWKKISSNIGDRDLKIIVSKSASDILSSFDRSAAIINHATASLRFN